MKNKGFTLIELLAVIVILAIIALIATPRILDVVEEARKGAAKSSVLGYIDAVEKQVMINQLSESEDDDITAGTYTVSTGENNLAAKKVSVKGDAPVDVTGENKITTKVDVDDKGAVATTSVFVTKGEKYKVTYKNGEWTVEDYGTGETNSGE